MNIYCIRDRMLDYFQDPFVAPNDNNVKASVANAINNPEATNALSQAPHHFEIWRVATVDDQGHIHESREFLGDVSALVRAQRPTTGPGSGQSPTVVQTRTGLAVATPSHARAAQPAPGQQLQGQDETAPKTPHAHAGGNN